ncbi:AMP-binding protein [Streptomyces sp. ODS28]|uniref:AMP-binding protein n=1 Tax=Streptomyces sp. ODS28 TaxID=3136688 RepID=UPI0031ED0FA9
MRTPGTEQRTGRGPEFTAPDVPLTALLDDAAARHPYRTALVCSGRRTRYRALRRASARFAAGLCALGVRRGERVALVLPNCPQFAVALYGTLRAGAVAVPVDAGRTGHALRHRLAGSGATVAVVHDGGYPAVAAVRGHTALRHVITVRLHDALPRWRRLALRAPLSRARAVRARLDPGLPADADALPYRRLLSAAPPRRAPRGRVDPRTAALLQYTAGTTGTPRAVVLSHRSLVANAHQVRAWWPGLREGRATVLSALPPTRPYGLTLGLNAGLLSGARTVLLPDGDPGALLRAARRWRPTLLPGVPALYEELLTRAPEELEALGTLRCCPSGAGPLPPETADRFRAATGLTPVEGYGLTEAAPVVLANPPNADARSGTAGLPLPGTEVRIVDEYDPSRVLAPGEAGELAVRGPQVCDGYWRDPAATARVLREGWLLTGDLCVRGPDGYVTVLGRVRQAQHAQRAGRAQQRREPREGTPAIPSSAGVTSRTGRSASPSPPPPRP